MPPAIGTRGGEFNRISAMTKFPSLERADSVAKAINPQYLSEEQPLVRELADRARLDGTAARAAGTRALALVQAVRSTRGGGGALDAFLREYSLASREGVILMCLAEALLRIPDGETADRLIADKIPSGAWDEHLGDSDSMLVNASTWGLMLTGRVINLEIVGATKHRFYVMPPIGRWRQQAPAPVYGAFRCGSGGDRLDSASS